MWNQSPYKLKPASQDLIKLYTLMGEALGAAQLIEDALSYAISMKKDLKDAGMEVGAGTLATFYR